MAKSVDIHDYDPIEEAKKVCLERFKQEDPEGYDAYIAEQAEADKKDKTSEKSADKKDK